MVAAISGSGLGLYNTSATNLNGQGTDGTAAQGRTGEQVYVNTATGNLVLQDDDQLLAAEGLDVAIVRTYNSQGTFNGGVGQHWRLGVDESLSDLTGTINTAGSTITKAFGDGAQVVYTYDAASGFYTSSAGPSADDTLSYDATTQQWTWTDSASRTVEVYDGAGQLLSSTDSSGNTITYGYTGSLLTQITDASGQVTTFTYSGGNITQISTQSNGVTQTLVYYSYDSLDRLTKVTVDLSPQDNSVSDGNTYVTSYTYQGGTDLISSITQSDGTSISFTYQLIDGEYRVASYTDGLGNKSTITYSQPTGTVQSGTLTGTPGWSGATVLGQGDTTTGSTSTPQVGFDSTGNGLAIWAQGDEVLARSYDKTTNTWATAVVVGSESSGTVYCPSLSVAANGDAVAAWVQSNSSGGYSTYVSRYSAASETWGAAQLLGTSADLITANGVFTASNSSTSSETAAVGWLQSNGTTTSLYISLWDAANAAWSTPTAVENSSNANPASQASIAISQSGLLTVLWRQSDGTTNAIFGNSATLNSSSGTWTWGTASQFETNDAAAASDPELAFDSQGNGLAIWAQGNDIMALHYDGATHAWDSSPTVVVAGSYPVNTPSLAVDPSTGDAVVGWVQSDGTANSAYAIRYDGATGTWDASPTLLEHSNLAVSADDEVVTGISNGNAVVGWLQLDSTGTDYLLNVARWNGAAWSDPLQLGALDNGHGTYQPRIAIDSQGNITALWAQSDGTTTSTYVNRYMNVWNWQNASVLQNSSAAQSNPQVAFDSQGNGLATWISGDDLMALSYDAATHTWASSPSVVVASSSPINTPSLAMDPNTGDAVLGWVQSNGTVNSAYAILYHSATGQWDTSPTQLENSHLAVSASDKVVTAINGGRAVVGWLQLDSTGTDYLLSVAQWNGAAWGSPQQLGTLNNGNGTYAPSIAMDSEGDISALWTQSDGTTTSTYVDRYTAGGSWSGPTVLAQGNTTTGSTSQPLIGFDSTGNGLAIWQQGNEVLASSYDKSTNTWSTATVLYSAGSGAIFAPPSLSVAANGDAVAAWEEGTNSAGFTRYVAQFTAATSSWSAVQSLGSLPGFAAGNTVATAISSGSSPETAAAGWIGFDSAGTARLYVSLWDAGTGSWSSPTYVPEVTNGNGASQPSLAISPDGEASAVWKQGNVVYINGASYAAEPPAANSITATANSSALSSAVPPASPSYTVQANDTWDTIALAVYGTSDPNAGAALQSVMDNPALSSGMQLAVPATLTYSPSGTDYSTQTEITDALGNTTTTVNDSSGRLVEIEAPSVNGASPETQFTYGTDGKLAQVTQYVNGAARSTVYEYDANGNLLLSRDADGNTVTRTYDAADQVLTETTYSVADPNGTSPLDTASGMTTWYVYDVNERLQFTVSPTGNVTEYLYDSKGNRTSQVVFTGAEYNVSGLSTTTVPTLAQMTSWAGSQDLTQTDRTDYTYDFRGNLSTSTTYGQTDSTGSGVATTASTTQYVYDQSGRLLETIDPRGEGGAPQGAYATTYTYDGVGRTLSETQWISSSVSDTTLYQYDDAKNTITTTLANGLITTSVYNADDELVSQSRATSSLSLGTTTYTYDADGLLRTVTNPDGIETHYLYDALGRKVATVDGNGALTEYVYNAAGQIVETVGYAGAVDTSSLADVNGAPANVSLATLIQEADTNPAANEVSRSVYDSAGRLIYSIDDAGAVTENIYDGTGRITDVIAYAAPVSIPAGTGALTPSQVPVVSSASDRHTRNFYDSNGNVIGTLDAAGYLTQYQYDDAGLLVTTTAYATATTASLRASGTLAQLIPASDSAHDVVTHYLYDNQGRQVGVVDGEGYLTQTEYDAEGNVSETIRYATPVTYTAASTLASLIPSGSSEVTQYQYDGANRVVQETNYQGTVTQNQYDAVGDLISSTVAAGTADARTTQTRYDALGRVIARLTPQGSAQITSGMTQSQINAIWAQYGVSYSYDAAGLKVSMTDQNGNTTYYYYDDDGQLRYTVNAAGDVTEARYDAFGHVTAQIAYDTPVSTSGLTGGLVASSNIGSLVQAIANSQIDSTTTTSYAYDASGRTETTTTSEGASTTEQFDAFGDITSRTQAISTSRSLTTDYTYDQRSLLLETISDPSGLDTTQSDQYDAFGRVVQTTDANGNVTKYAYDRLGRDIQTTDALGNVSGTTYDAFSRVLSTTDALGNLTKYSYNDSARTMTVTSPGGITVSTAYNEHGQKVQVTDGDGNVTSYAYDTNGQLTSTTDSLGTLNSNTFDAAGRLLTSTDAGGVVTAYSYDAANRVLSKTVDPSGLALTTKYAYDGEGRTISTTSTQGVTTTTQYDRDGRVTQVVVDPYNATSNPNGLNLVTAYTYDELGDVLTVTQGAGSSNPRVTQYTYDALGRRIQEVVDPGTGNNPATGQPYLNLTTQYRYDANGNLVRKIDANGNSSWYVYDADNRLHYTVDALGGITETDYDADGRLSTTRRYATAMTPPASTVDQLSASQVAAVASPEDRVEQNFYDADGHEAYTIDAPGTVAQVITQRTYDADGNVIQLRVIGGATPLTGTYANAAAVTAALGSTANTLGSADRVQWTAYDARNRAVYSIDALGAVTQTQYDGDGNVVSSTAYATLVAPPSSMVTSITETGQTITVDGTTTLTVSSSANDRTTRYWYDTAGRRVYTLSPTGYLTRAQYNDAERTQTVTIYATAPTIPAGASTSDLENGTNGAVVSPTGGTTLSTGQVVGADQVTTTYYDAAGRVSKVTDALGNSEAYGYDALGNKTSYTNKNGQTWTYKYDADGRLIEQDSPYVSVSNVTWSSGTLTSTPETASIITRMTYDGLGNVKTLTEGIEHFSNGTEDDSHSRVTSYAYDVLGRQASVTLPAVLIYNGISSDNVDATGSAVGSNSTSQTPTTQVVYDALGDAIASRDAGGNWTYKVYDQLGRVVYDIDALNFVTGYTYDAFGNQLTTTRYATALSGSISSSNLVGLEVQSQNANGATIAVTNGSTSGTVSVIASSQDRTITSVYDRDNRVEQVSQPAVFTFIPNAGAAGGQTFTASPTTFYDYNAFGQVVRTAQLVNTDGNSITDPDVDPNANAWSYSYTYYDQGGNKTGEINADGYLTTYQYDAEGNLIDQYEYAQPASSASISGYAAPSPSSTDRETQYQYDQLNRQVTKTLKGVQYSQISGSAGSLTESAASGDAITYYAYDALGNQTSVTENGATTSTYYDALGRAIATVGPSANRGDGTTVTPLTLMQRDAFGNVVAETQYAAGLTSTPAPGAAPTASNTTANADEDRTIITLRDAEGRALQAEQKLTALNSGEGSAIGNIDQYYAYDALGNLVKQYQAASGTDTLVTFYEYDALGRQTDVIRPETLGSTNVVPDEYTEYTPFGEVKGKGTGQYGDQKDYQEVFFYDAAGRMYLTNAGDGAYHAYLYDLAGNATGELEDQWTENGTSYDLSALSSQSSAGNAYSAYTSNTGALMFTQTRYDAMGNVVEKRLPTYSAANAAEAISNSSVQVQTINGTTYLTWDTPADSTLQPTLYIDGNQEGITTLSGAGSEYGYEAGFALTGLSYGTHTYRIQYSRPNDTTVSGVATGSFVVNPSLAISTDSTGTVTNLDAVLSGSSLQVSWTPDTSSVTPTFSILVNGTWRSYSGSINESGAASVTLTAPAAGTYQYRVTDTVNGETEAQGTGTINITAPTTTTSLGVAAGTVGTVNSVSASVSGSTASVSWTPDSGVTSSAFAILIGGTWTSYTPTLTESGTYSVNFPLPAAGSYQYRITDLVNGETEAQGTGSISFTAATSSTSLANSTATTGTVNSVSSSVSGSTVTVNWTPDSGVTSSTFAILINGTWTSYTPTLTESGTYSVSFPMPAAGTYQYRIADLVNGVTEAQGTGSISFTAASSTTTTTGSATAAPVWYTPAPVSASAAVGTQGSGTVTSSATPTQTAIRNEAGQITGYTDSWSGTDSVSLTWLDLASGTYTLNIYYNTAANSTYGISSAAESKSFTVSGGTGGTFSWTDPTQTNSFAPGGISSISYFQILQSGTVVRDSRSSGVTTTTISWSAPSDTSYNGALQYRLAGTSTYTLVTASRSGSTFQVPLSELAPGTYDYIAEVFQNTAESPTNETQVSGQFVVASNSASISSQSGTPAYLSGVSVSGSNLTWAQAPESGASVQVQLVGSNTYNLSPSSSNGTNYTASFYNLPSGTYTYYINYVSGGSTYLQGKGTISINTTTTTTPASDSIGTPTQLSTVSGFEDLGSGVFGWTTAANSGDTIVFHYKASGASSWAGTLPVSGTGPYSVNLSSLSGSIDYEVDYTASGAAQPYRVGRGTVTIDVTTTPATASIGTPTQLSAVSTPTDLGSEVLGWTTAANSGDTIVFHYKASGASSWAGTLPISGSGPSYSVDLSSLSGSIDYEIDYTASGAMQPYRVGRGTVSITQTTNPGAASISAPTELSSVTGFSDLGGGNLGWTTAANSGDTLVFHYKASGASSWAGTLPVSGTGPYSVNLSSLSGSIDYEVDYIASGAAQPYRVGRGTITISPSFSGASDTTASSLPAAAAAPYELQAVDRWGNVTSFTDAAGQTTNYAYNRYNDMVEKSDPTVTAVSVAMASSGSSGTVGTSTTTPISHNYYDLYGRLIGTQDADGNVDGQNYNAANEVISEQHADGGKKTYVYDTFGDQIQVTTLVDESGSYETRNAYDQAGRLTDTEQELVSGTFTGAASGFANDLLPRSNANVIRNTFGYDEAGRRITSTDGAGDTTSTAYDLHGNVISTTPPAGIATYYGYDAEDHRTSETDADGRTQSWNYDYFGHLQSHVDLGGATFTYTYDATRSGLLSSETSTADKYFGAQSKTYSYDSANHVTEIDDTGVNSVTYYSYDTAGRVERQQTIDDNLIAEDTRTEYDAMGRISNLSGLGFSVNYSYDAAGNRTHILADYATSPTSYGTQDLWYGYDAMNRVLIDQGVNTSGTIGATSNQGTILTYDWRGDRTSATAQGSYINESGVNTYQTVVGMTDTTYTYDGAGRLTDIILPLTGNGSSSTITVESRQYDQASRLVNDTTEFVDSSEGDNLSTQVQTNAYNPNGTVSFTTTKKNGVTQSTVDYSQVVVSTESGNVVTSGYDAAGNLMGDKVSNYDSTGATVTSSYTDAYTYAPADSYLQTSHTEDNGETENTYNSDQQLIQYTDTQNTANNRYFLNNADGQVLTVVQGSNDGTYTVSYDANGNVVGSSTAYGADSAAASALSDVLMSGSSFFQSNSAGYFFYDSKGNSVGSFGKLTDPTGTFSANFDVNFTPVSEQYPAAEPPQYVVAEGDTLALIAMQVYGDASLWYVIADANGLTGTAPNATLTQGTRLTIPNVVVALPNSADSFKPFDVSQALGNTTPTQPPPPAQSGGCGTFGAILVAVVAVVVTIATHGLTTEWAAEALSELGVSGTTAGSVGAAVASDLGWAASAAIGSVAGQTVGIAIGQQSSYNWREVASAAAAGAVAGSLTGAEGQWATTTPGEVASAAIESAVSQGVDDALGLQKGFNWAAVAAAALAAPLAQAAGSKVSKSLQSSGLSAEEDQIAGSLTRASVDQITYALFTGGKINYAQIVADGFGTPIGDSIVQAETGPQYGLTNEEQQQELSGLNASTNAALGQENTKISAGISAQLAAAAGSSSFAQDAPLTDNLQLADPEVQLQPINVNLPAISLPALSSSDIFGTGAPIVGNVNDLTPSATVPTLQTVMVRAPRLPQESSSSSPGFWSRVWSDVKTAGEVAGGAVELTAAGAYNEGLRIAGGLASIPYLLDSTNAAVAVQNAFQSHDWNPQGEGVQMIDRALQPVEQFVQNDITNPLHNWSEQHLGDAATTFLGSTVQAGMEIGGVLGLAGAGRTVAGLLDASEATAEVVPLADGGIPVANGIRYGGFNGPGPLGVDVAKTFRSSSYTQEVLQQDMTLYRVYGGKAGAIGSYLTDVPPAGPLQSIEDSALNPVWGNTAQSVSTIRVPAGTTIYRGFAASQPLPGGGSLIGGGSQIYIPKVNPDWLVH